MRGVADRAGVALTSRQRELLEFLRRRYRATGSPPTIREMADEFRCNVNAIMGHLRALLAKGMVTCGDGARARQWRPAVPPGHCPCCGRPTEGEA